MLLDLLEKPGVFGFFGISDLHPQLVPSIPREDALLLEPVLDSEEYGTIRPLGWVGPTSVHCEVLAAVWSPGWCTDLFIHRDDDLRPGCRDFKRHVFGLFDRHPKLHTLYLFDPTIVPSGLVPLGDPVPRFRGTDATYYQVDFDGYDASTSGWVVSRPTNGDMSVLEYAGWLDDLLYQAREEMELGPRREIRVKVLVCVRHPSTLADVTWESFLGVEAS
jgi:hypothetical protein